MGKSQRDKGARWERQVAALFREAGYPDAKRGFQTRGGAAEEPDVRAGQWDIECKVGKQPPIRKALVTAVEHARPGQVGIAIIKEDRRPPFVVLELEAFLALVRR